MPLPSQDQSLPPGLPAALANNPALAKAALQAVSGNSVAAGPSIGNGGTTSYSSIVNALIGTSLDVTGRYGLTGQPDYTGGKPAWLQIPPTAYHALMGSNNYDPWYGVISSNADDRVYLGPTTVTKRRHKPVTEPTGPFMMPASAGGADTLGPGSSLHRDMPHGTQRTETKQVHTDSTVTVQQAMNLPMGWSDKQVADTITKMQKAGFSNVKTFDQMMGVWGQLVQRASGMYAYSEGQNKVTPWDVLSMYGKEAVKTGLVDKNGQAISPLAGTTHTSTTKTVSDVTQGDAWNALQQTLSQLLGRDPSQQEIRDFAYRMNSLAAKNPTVTKSVTTYNNQGDPNTTSSTHGGFSSSDVAEAAYNQAQNDPNYAEHQAATLYYNAAVSGLGAIGQVGG